MIQIITIENGTGLIDRQETDALTLPIVGDVVADRIYIRPDWPPIGDPQFEIKLRAWHTAHNIPSSHQGEE